jgi:hypothetical protein
MSIVSYLLFFFFLTEINYVLTYFHSSGLTYKKSIYRIVQLIRYLLKNQKKKHSLDVFTKDLRSRQYLIRQYLQDKIKTNHVDDFRRKMSFTKIVP